jgi:anthranilate phosphoribosyltransferase
MLDTFGIACAGPFVYPRELRLLARQILPFDMKTVGRFFNLIGPFLAAVPVSMQITGVSDHSVLPTFRQLVSEDSSKRYWVTWNDMGVDELLSVTDSHVYDSARGEQFDLRPGDIGLGAGSFDDLLPVSELDATVPHFLRLISGEGPPAALESIRLNAAALAINGEVVSDWAEGLQLAAQTMSSGEPVALIERIRVAGAVAAAATPKPAAAAPEAAAAPKPAATT